jgi:uncharacterized protein (DUF2141 family)
MSGNAVKGGFRIVALLGGGLLGASGSAALAHADSATVAISGQVRGASGQHAVYVALWRSDGFLKRPFAQVRLAPAAATEFKFVAAPGPYALSAFEDRNDNGVLDMGLFGPKEPTGFWRAFHAWRKPKFEDVSAVLTHDTPDADITLK